MPSSIRTGQVTHVIGIAGCSGAGKTTVARALADRLKGGAVLLPLDAYYRDVSQSTPEERNDANFDEPDAFDVPLLVTHIQALSEGHPVDRPTYDFVRHCRQIETVRVTPGAFVIVEGLLTFHWTAVRELCHPRIFLDAHDAVRLSRRVARDATERGRSEASVRRQWTTTVAAMSTRYVDPTRKFADAVVDARLPIDLIVSSVTQRFGW
jgi:uridine kinase